jgi:hypothetical protein
MTSKGHILLGGSLLLAGILLMSRSPEPKPDYGCDVPPSVFEAFHKYGIEEVGLGFESFDPKNGRFVSECAVYIMYYSGRTICITDEVVDETHN